MNGKSMYEKPRVFESQLQQDEKQSIEFSAQVKRESAFFAKWKDRQAVIVYLPNQQFSLTFYNKDKRTIDEIVNLNLTKVSGKCSTIQQRFCFGLEMVSGRRYLIAGANREQLLAAFQLVFGVKKRLRAKSQFMKSQVRSKQASIKQQLQFEKSNDSQQERQREKKQEYPKLLLSTVQSPSNQPLQLRQYQRDDQKGGLIAIQREQNELKVVSEVLPQLQSSAHSKDQARMQEEQPIVIQQFEPVHLKMPLEQEELQYLQSDEGFKLVQTFSEGRILQKSQRFIKANLIFKTPLTSEQLLESFFHMQLWNQKVKHYKLANRIDRGIYLIEMEIHKRRLFGSSRFCFMMLSALKIKKEPFLIMRSLEESHFQGKSGKQWIDFSLWLKVRGEDSQKMYKMVSLCASVQNDRDLDIMMSFLQQLKYYQSFLFTTNKPPFKVLQWTEQEKHCIQ